MATAKPPSKNIPDALKDEAEEAHEKLVEMIAEGDDEMMEEFFREGTIPIADLIPAVRKAIVAEKIFPGPDGFFHAQRRHRQLAHFPGRRFSPSR